ncbi:MAG: 50S ribosomal protein L19 [Candidatus Moranbacteria bacterium]|nr:50S ribosomal protein L19 [Candidatus Moranbacteria bacterium]
MHKDLIAFNAARRTKDVPELHSGDVVKVYRRIVEGGKERTQVFQGMVIAMRGGQSSSPTVTVRKVSFGTGVEIVFPLYSPNIEKIEVVKSTRSRRAKLYYVREKSAKLLRRKLKEVALKVGKGGVKSQEEMEPEVAEDVASQEGAEAEVVSEAGKEE